jgi:hypothetical protein
MDQLLADRAMQLGDRCNLKEFHDEFLAAGMIPISLIRWEMTGLHDEVRRFWVNLKRDKRAKAEQVPETDSYKRE